MNTFSVYTLFKSSIDLSMLVNACVSLLWPVKDCRHGSADNHRKSEQKTAFVIMTMRERIHTTCIFAFSRMHERTNTFILFFCVRTQAWTTVRTRNGCTRFAVKRNGNLYFCKKEIKLVCSTSPSWSSSFICVSYIREWFSVVFHNITKMRATFKPKSTM